MQSKLTLIAIFPLFAAFPIHVNAKWTYSYFRYIWANSTSNPQNLYIANPDITIQNNYLGGIYQQATSGVTEANQTAYELNGNNTAVYAYEYVPGFDNAWAWYLEWRWRLLTYLSGDLKLHCMDRQWSIVVATECCRRGCWYRYWNICPPHFSGTNGIRQAVFRR